MCARQNCVWKIPCEQDHRQEVQLNDDGRFLPATLPLRLQPVHDLATRVPSICRRQDLPPVVWPALQLLLCRTVRQQAA